MYKIDLNVDYQYVEGEKPQGMPDKLCGVLSFVMAKSQNTSNPIKLWGWSVKLSKSGIIEIDKEDLEILKEFILKNEMMFVATKGQLMEIIDKATKEEI